MYLIESEDSVLEKESQEDNREDIGERKLVMHGQKIKKGQPDDVLGKDETWNRSRVHNVYKDISFYNNDRQIVSLPILVSNISDRICTGDTVTIQTKEARVVEICTKGLSGEVDGKNKEILTFNLDRHVAALPLIVSNSSEKICIAETVTIEAREAKMVAVCAKGFQET